MPALHDRPSLLVGDSTWPRARQIEWLRANVARNIRLAYDLLQRGDWHNVGAIAVEIVEDLRDIGDTPALADLQAQFLRTHVRLVNAMVDSDWIGAKHEADSLRFLEAGIRGLASRRQGADRLARIDYLREQVRQHRHLMQRREDSLAGFLLLRSEEQAELEGLRT